MEKNVVYKNKSVFYRVTGEGKPVVLIHGVPVDGSLWISQEAALSGEYRLIIPDLPGSGKSELIEDMSMEGMAEVIKAVLDAELISEAIMVGHSMGGYISIAFEERFPAILKGLAFFHSSVFADNEEKKVSRKKNISFIQRHGSYEFIKQSTPGLFSDSFKKDNEDTVDKIIEQYKDVNPNSLAAYQKAMMDRPDRRKILEQIVKPVLFIIGEHDKAIPFQDSMEQCHIPALSYIHIFKKSGHMGMLEEAEKSSDILKMFLKDIF